MQNYTLIKQEYKNKARKDFELYYKQENLNRRQNYQYNKRYKTPDEAETYFSRLQEYDLIELDKIKKLLESYTEKSVLNNKNTQRMFLDSIELESKFTPISLTTFGGLYKTVMYRLTPSITSYFSTGNHLYKPIMDGENYLGENPAFYNDDRLIAAICTHEKYAVLYLRNDELNLLQSLNIPFKT